VVRAVVLGIALSSVRCGEDSTTGPTRVPVAGVVITPPAATILDGQTVELGTVLLDPNGGALTGRTIVWESSDTTIAKVRAPGLVTGAAVGGPVMISAMCEGQRGTTMITVVPVPVATVTVAPVSSTVTRGQTLQLTATTADTNGGPLTGRTVTWTSSDPAVATVSATGLVTSVAVGGPVTITATSEGQTGSAGVTVTPVPVATVAVSPATASITPGQTQQLIATPTDAQGDSLPGRTVTWTSSDPAVATVSATGLVTAVAVGAATITATSEGQTGSATITITPVPVAVVAVTPAAAILTVGLSQQLTATLTDAQAIPSPGAPSRGRVATPRSPP